MIHRINHIGVAVRSLGPSADLFARLLGAPADHTEHVEEQRADIAFFPVGGSSLELIESTAPDSAIAKFIAKRGEGIHHICLEVSGIEGEIARLKGLGFVFVNDVPTDGGHGMRVAFLHPSSTNGVLVELCEPGPGTPAR